MAGQATMQRMGHVVTARDYARAAARVGIAAIAAALAVHIALTLLTR